MQCEETIFKKVKQSVQVNRNCIGSHKIGLYKLSTDKNFIPGVNKQIVGSFLNALSSQNLFLMLHLMLQNSFFNAISKSCYRAKFFIYLYYNVYKVTIQVIKICWVQQNQDQKWLGNDWKKERHVIPVTQGRGGRRDIFAIVARNQSALSALLLFASSVKKVTNENKVFCNITVDMFLTVMRYCTLKLKNICFIRNCDIYRKYGHCCNS